MKKRFYIKAILIILFLISVCFFIYCYKLYSVRKNESIYFYRQRYTLDFVDNKPFYMDQIPGNTISLKEVSPLKFDLLSRNWVVVVDVERISDINGETEKLLYVVGLTYSASIFDSEPLIIKTTITPPEQSIENIKSEIINGEMLFLYEDYFFNKEIQDETNSKAVALLEKYKPPKIEFGNDQFKNGEEIYITSTQGTKLLYGDGKGNSSYIDLLKYIPDKLNNSNVLNLEKNYVLVCGEIDAHKYCYVISLPDFKLVKKYDVTEKWGFIFLSPKADGIFIIRTNESESEKLDFIGEVLFIDFQNEEKKYEISKNRPRIFFNEETKQIKFLDIYLSQTLLKVDLDEI